MANDPEETQTKPNVPKGSTDIVDQKEALPNLPEASAACGPQTQHDEASAPDERSVGEEIILWTALLFMLAGISVGGFGGTLFHCTVGTRLNSILLAFIFLSACIGMSQRVNQRTWAAIQFFAGLALWLLAVYFTK